MSKELEEDVMVTVIATGFNRSKADSKESGSQQSRDFNSNEIDLEPVGGEDELDIPAFLRKNS